MALTAATAIGLPPARIRTSGVPVSRSLRRYASCAAGRSALVEPLLEIVHLRKRYGTFEALKDISLSVGRGEIVALLGANGSGKSTLLHILSGHAVIDETGGYEGEVRLAGRCLALRSSRDALAAGIGMVHQELSLLPGLSVADNIFLSRERTEFSLPAPLSLLSWVDRSAQRRDGAQALASLGIVADVDRAVRSVSLPLRFLVEFAREKARDDLRLLLLDEPTSGLNRHESATMLQAVRELAARGVGVLFVSHKIHEALELCHRILVLKDGVLAAEFSRKDFRYGGVVRAMFGNDLASSSDEAVERRRSDDGPSVLEFRHLETRSADEDLTGFSLDVRRGEIVGITSLLGQGKGAFTRFSPTKLCAFPGRCACWARVWHGTIRFFDGKWSSFRKTASGIAFLPGAVFSKTSPFRPTRCTIAFAVADSCAFSIGRRRSALPRRRWSATTFNALPSISR